MNGLSSNHQTDNVKKWSWCESELIHMGGTRCVVLSMFRGAFMSKVPHIYLSAEVADVDKSSFFIRCVFDSRVASAYYVYTHDIMKPTVYSFRKSMTCSSDFDVSHSHGSSPPHKDQDAKIQHSDFQRLNIDRRMSQHIPHWQATWSEARQKVGSILMR